MPPTSRGEDKQRGRGRKLFLEGSTFQRHYDAIGKDRVRYAAILTMLQRTGTEISQVSKVHALSAAWAHHDQDLANCLLTNTKAFGLVEVLKAASLLDTGRRVRTWERRLKRLQMYPKKLARKQNRAVGKIKAQINSLMANKPKAGTLSGAVIRHIKRWMASVATRDLEFFALHMPKEPWQKLADLVHFNPAKDFPDLPWFLPFCYGKRPPMDSLVSSCSNVSETRVNGLLLLYDIPYSHIKHLKQALNEESKELISQREKLDTLLWYYEDLACPAVDKVIEERLKAGEEVTLPYGKLMERLLIIKVMREEKMASQQQSMAQFYHLLVPIAERRLSEINISIDAPVVVLGDRSQSMSVAVQTSTIIASLLCAISKAELCFFNRSNHQPPNVPRTIEEVLHLATTMTAVGGTAPAASLYPYYEAKKVVKTFIVVTDEEENDPIIINYMPKYFADLFEKYHKEVYPAKLVFVSFLKQQHSTGKMVQKLQAKGFRPLQFRLDEQRPDLVKLNNLLGLLAMESQDFSGRVKEVESEIRGEGLKKVLERLVI
ncbi:uncharacterized protein LOC110986179 [Acanthaster planci]|uniref:Uncharacterized protein LOC110986179 n=1 Tax=Acanthaster planci TaxID=133434 RepID=A0A8B7ZFA2_ACAPL|nr:uncharacterized protein LOC110986179 [Acanthaster planci]XP_022103531.1 uncharacterized protein LOC110986179 [Acanthaster planci]XP_022103532.1 uncharacterized protein LOC110986179 [Acanthaster planci]XP_022103533.1 uncharacterized protein LOC110986179 [Acanthaster planci]XP_022103534.1 uncharacterized protein LOC110986179 [Acanthaster planci]XP_022103535.1 uncharacterized protein LOC110986179 [Acanthaster planci]